MKKSVIKSNILHNFETKLFALLKNNYIEDIKPQIHHTKQSYMNILLTFDMNYLYYSSLILFTFLGLIKIQVLAIGCSQTSQNSSKLLQKHLSMSFNTSLKAITNFFLLLSLLNTLTSFLR